MDARDMSEMDVEEHLEAAMDEARQMSPGSPEAHAIVAQIHLAWANAKIAKKLSGVFDEERVGRRR
jgi:hypothetical protein